MTENNSHIIRREKSFETDLVVPIELFGSDHWGVFIKVEEAALNNRGMLQPERLNIAYSKRNSFPRNIMVAGEYPTQIKASEMKRGDGRYGVRKVDGYDDIDCLADLERAGLVDAELPSVDQDKFMDPDGEMILDEDGAPLSPFLAPELLENIILKHTRWRLTEYGTSIAFQLQKYKVSGQPLHSFVAAQPHEAI